MPATWKYIEKGKRNELGRTLRRGNRYSYNRRGVNGASCGEEGNNVDYYDGNWGNSDSQRDHSLSQVNIAGGETNYSSREVEFGEIDGWAADSDVVNNLVSRRASGEYRGADRAENRDAFGPFAKSQFSEAF